MVLEQAKGASQALEIIIVEYPEFGRMLADVEFDRIDIERQSVFKPFEAVFEALSGGAAVTNNVKVFAKTRHKPSRSGVVGSETGTLNYTREVDLQK